MKRIISESQLRDIVTNSVKKILNETIESTDETPLMKDAINALRDIKGIIHKAQLEYVWEPGPRTPLQQAMTNVMKAILAVEGFSEAGQKARMDSERWQHEQD